MGASLFWSRALRGQEQRIRSIGALLGIAEGSVEGLAWVSSFRKGLEEAGWIEGRNYHLELRWPAADPGLMRTQSKELLDLPCDLVLTHASPATAAFRKVAPSVPNIFVAVVDPISSGFVETMAHPGGNSTGFTNFEASMGGKWLDLLREITPNCKGAGILLNPDTFPGGFGSSHVKAIEASAKTIGISLSNMPFRDAAQLQAGFDALDRDSVSGLLVIPDTSTTQHGKLIVELANADQLPTIYPYRDFIRAGGLLCYGVDRADLYRRASSYADRILRGVKPSELPVQAPTKFEFVLNMKTASKLGLTISPTLLAQADDVIE